MTPLIITGSILIFLAILLIIPLRITVEYESTVLVTVKYLFFKLYTYDPNAPEKPKKPKKKKKAKAVDQPKPVKDEKAKAKDTIDLLFALFEDLKKALGILIKRVVVSKLKLTLVVAEGDAAETAIAYGKMSAYIYGGFAIVNNFINFKKPEIHLHADFNNKEYFFKLQCTIIVAPWMLLAAGIRGLFAIVKKSVQKRTDGKNTEKIPREEQSETADNTEKEKVVKFER